MARRRPRRVRILLPGEREGRRGFLKKGLAGVILLALGGGAGFLASRRTRVRTHPSLAGPFTVFDVAQAAVILAIADRMIPERAGFPRPGAIGLPAKVDAIAAMSPPASQKELRQLVGLFESALAGLLDGSPRLFTECDPATQDRRLDAWMNSRLAVRRTGFRALRRMVHAAYYASPETWPAVGYPGPPLGVTARPPTGRPEAGGASPQRPAPEQLPPRSQAGPQQAAPVRAEDEAAPPPRPRRFRPSPVQPAGEPVPAAPEGGPRGQ